MIRYLYIEANRGKYPIAKMAKWANVSKSGYYAWHRRRPSQRDIANDELLRKIRELHKITHESYGPKRMAAQISKDTDKPVNHKRVERIINASKEAQWQEMAKNKDRESKSLLGAVYSDLKDAQDHGIIKAFIASSLQDSSTHVALSGDMTEMLAILADVVVDICDEEPDKIARFCDSLEEAAVVELAKRKALH